MRAATAAPESTCKESLQVADIREGMVVEGEHGPSVVLSVEETEWRFSRKPARRIMFEEIATGEKYQRMYHPCYPIPGNLASVAIFKESGKR